MIRGTTMGKISGLRIVTCKFVYSPAVVSAKNLFFLIFCVCLSACHISFRAFVISWSLDVKDEGESFIPHL